MNVFKSIVNFVKRKSDIVINGKQEYRFKYSPFPYINVNHIYDIYNWYVYSCKINDFEICLAGNDLSRYKGTLPYFILYQGYAIFFENLSIKSNYSDFRRSLKIVVSEYEKIIKFCEEQSLKTLPAIFYKSSQLDEKTKCSVIFEKEFSNTLSKGFSFSYMENFKCQLFMLRDEIYKSQNNKYTIFHVENRGENIKGLQDVFDYRRLKFNGCEFDNDVKVIANSCYSIPLENNIQELVIWNEFHEFNIYVLFSNSGKKDAEIIVLKDKKLFDIEKDDRRQCYLHRTLSEEDIYSLLDKERVYRLYEPSEILKDLLFDICARYFISNELRNSFGMKPEDVTSDEHMDYLRMMSY